MHKARGWYSPKCALLHQRKIITLPESFLVDGIQVSSDCTLGKANIRVRQAHYTSAIFQKGHRRVVIRLSQEVIKTLSTLTKRITQITLNEQARSLYRMPDRQLLAIDY
jgi:formylmethanofuran dehydrogenase subunit E